MSVFTLNNVSFLRDDVAILNNITFSIKKDKRTAIVGPNGAGKSTILYHLNGLFTPNSGELFFKNQLIDKQLQKALPGKVGIVFQDPDDQIVSLTVRDDIAFGPLQLGVEKEEVSHRINKYSHMLGIEYLVDRNPTELSYGQKKYVTIAGILAMETEVIVLDEPMAFLDPKGKEKMIEIMDLLQQTGKDVIVTTHDMQFVAEWADEVIIIHKGECLGVFTPGELFTNEALLKQARLNLPPTLQVLKSFWKKEWGEIPLKIADINKWFIENMKC